MRLARSRRRGSVWSALGYGLAAGIVLTFLGACVYFWSAYGADWARAWTHPDRLAGVEVIAAGDMGGRSVAPVVARDFDGDGTADLVETEYVRREPILGRVTSGMIRVLSGADGSMLAQRATSTPICRERWIGDVDGNGTDDIAFEDGLETLVLARAR